jgi:uncharacterized membrane protein YbhN (UPF0104 family)
MTQAPSIPAPKRRWKAPPWAVTVLKLLCSAAVLVYFATTVDFSITEKLVQGTDLKFVVLLVLFAILEPALAGLRFKLLLDPVERLPITNHVAYYYCAYYFNLVLPSSLGGDGVRFVFLSRHGIAKSQSATALVAERVLGIFSLIFVCGAAALFADLPPEAERTVFIAVAVASAGVLGLWGASRLAGRLAIKSEIVSKVAGALTELGRPSPRLAAVFVSSVIYQAVGVLLTVMAAFAFRIDVTALEVFAFVPLIWFLTMVPLSLGGLGVREAGFVYLFGTVGVPEGASLLLSLGTYAGLVAAGAVGGVVLLFQARLLPRAEAAPRPGLTQ